MAEYGLRILLYAEAAAQAKEQERQIRLALLAQGADVHLLFPEIFAPGDGKREDGVPADVSEDYDRVSWQAPGGEDEWEHTLAALASTRVQVPTADPDAGWV